MSLHSDEISAKERFEFGRNWYLFLGSINEERITLAEKSLLTMLKLDDLRGKRFLDIGSGSGLFSLAARRLGATVHSFDYDPQSVACTQELKRRFFPGDDSWTIESGSVLDDSYVAQLGMFDIVYSWGVLHHTGAMWKAMENVATTVSAHGLLYIAIYNRQQLFSAYWRRVKKFYNRAPRPVRKSLEYGFWLYFVSSLFLVDVFRGRNPFDRHSGRGRRGMNFFRDIVDWIGGWPFEVAAPEDVFHFYNDREFNLVKLKTCGGKQGCNEFVFVRSACNQKPAVQSQ
ncbi:class I SAM-dependent methyltransferase [Burkholderiaceae bacterium]|nr:class I SAM-dependent methyltransferase [Burkholderiaceae bacterium]